MQKQQLESRPLEESTTANIVSDVTNCNLSSTGIKRFIKRESPLTSEENNGAAPVRINRAARLRAAATSGTPPPVEDKMGKIKYINEKKKKKTFGSFFISQFSFFSCSESKEIVRPFDGNAAHRSVWRACW